MNSIKLLPYFSILLTTFISAPVFSNPVCTQPFIKNVKFEKFLTSKNRELDKFSNRKEIASLADQTLSKLVSAKSKIIGNWMRKRSLESATEAEIVKSWRRYYAENFILSQYPSKDKEIDKLIRDLIEKMYTEFLPFNERKRIQKVYENAKKSAIRRIKSFKIKSEQKSKIVSRVSNMELYWMKSFKSSKFKNRPLEVFSWGVAYDPVPNEINMGIEVLQYSSDETLFAVFAHEIGHSFDPCRWGAFFDSPYPFKKVVSCLRGSKSVAAKKRDDSKMNLLIKGGKLSKGLAAALRLNTTCNKAQYPPLGTQADQAPESFADWFSAEVISGTDLVNLKIRNDLCVSKKLVPGSSYPSNILRLERIYLSHPKIKKELKFKGVGQYCSV